MEKKKILVLGDHPLTPSGVGTQLKYICEALLKTGKYKVVSLGGAVKHPDYRPMKVEPWGEDFIIIPVDGYGNPDTIRSAIRNERPDVLLFMTDPRFYYWLWETAQEIRPLIPMVYYHVWDNLPYPTFNKPYYDSNDLIVTISKVTDDIVKNVSPGVKSIYLPHAVPDDVYKPLPEESVKKFVNDAFSSNKDMDLKNRVLFFFNSRNARRKQSASMVFWFKEFLDEVGHDKATLMMHTNPHDEHGSNLEACVEFLGLADGQVLFSRQKVDNPTLALIYNMVDCTIGISDAEGFGLSSLESLACGTPVINTMTGGLQEQVFDGKQYFGVGIKPASQAIVGSQEIPWIYEDRISKEDFIKALKKIYSMTPEKRKALGLKGRKHVEKNYSFANYEKRWVEVIDEACETHGSWDTRKGYKGWSLKEIK